VLLEVLLVRLDKVFVQPVQQVHLQALLVLLPVLNVLQAHFQIAVMPKAVMLVLLDKPKLFQVVQLVPIVPKENPIQPQDKAVVQTVQQELSPM
jgi:hypothetical protein